MPRAARPPARDRTEAQGAVSARIGEEAAVIMDAWTGKLDGSLAPT